MGPLNTTSETWQIDGRSVRVSHLDKLYWPEDGLTKADMLRYYLGVAPVLLPYCSGRPVTLRVFPDGVQGTSYYRRDLPEDAPEWLRSVDYSPETTERKIQLPLVENAAGLVWLANKGSIEFHLWASRLPDLVQPDLAIFDLDPGEETSFHDVLQAALRLHEALDGLGLRSYAKTSGGRGLHVFLPLLPGHTFEGVRGWVKTMAERLATADPQLIAVAHGATHRGHQVTIDYAQNSTGRNTAAPYTLRGAPGAPVSTPLSWEEVAAGQVQPSELTLKTVPARLQQIGDLFAQLLEERALLPQSWP